MSLLLSMLLVGCNHESRIEGITMIQIVHADKISYLHSYSRVLINDACEYSYVQDFGFAPPLRIIFEDGGLMTIDEEYIVYGQDKFSLGSSLNYFIHKNEIGPDACIMDCE